MPKGWKYFVLSFAMTLFFCASLAMLVCIDQTCGGFDGAQTGTLLAFSPGENQVKVTLLSQEHTVSLTGLEPLRALWWKLYPLMPYPIKLGETLRKTDYAPLFSPEELTLLEEQREEAQKAPEEPPQEDEGAGEEIEEPESGEIGE